MLTPFLAMRKLPVGKSVFPDVEFRRSRSILLDCKVNASIAAPFMGEFAEFEARHQ